MRTKGGNARHFGHKNGEKTVSYTLFFCFLILSEIFYAGRLSDRQDVCRATSPNHSIRGPPMT